LQKIENVSAYIKKLEGQTILRKNKVTKGLREGKATEGKWNLSRGLVRDKMTHINNKLF